MGKSSKRRRESSTSSSTSDSDCSKRGKHKSKKGRSISSTIDEAIARLHPGNASGSSPNSSPENTSHERRLKREDRRWKKQIEDRIDSFMERTEKAVVLLLDKEKERQDERVRDVAEREKERKELQHLCRLVEDQVKSKPRDDEPDGSTGGGNKRGTNRGQTPTKTPSRPTTRTRSGSRPESSNGNHGTEATVAATACESDSDTAAATDGDSSSTEGTMDDNLGISSDDVADGYRQNDKGVRVARNRWQRKVYFCLNCADTTEPLTSVNAINNHRHQVHNLEEAEIPRERPGPKPANGIRKPPRKSALKAEKDPRGQHKTVHKSKKYVFRLFLNNYYDLVASKEYRDSNPDKEQLIEDRTKRLWEDCWVNLHPLPPPGALDSAQVKLFLKWDNQRQRREAELELECENHWLYNNLNPEFSSNLELVKVAHFFFRFFYINSFLAEEYLYFQNPCPFEDTHVTPLHRMYNGPWFRFPDGCTFDDPDEGLEEFSINYNTDSEEDIDRYSVGDYEEEFVDLIAEECEGELSTQQQRQTLYSELEDFQQLPPLYEPHGFWYLEGQEDTDDEDATDPDMQEAEANDEEADVEEPDHHFNEDALPGQPEVVQPEDIVAVNLNNALDLPLQQADEPEEEQAQAEEHVDNGPTTPASALSEGENVEHSDNEQFKGFLCLPWKSSEAAKEPVHTNHPFHQNPMPAISVTADPLDAQPIGICFPEGFFRRSYKGRTPYSNQDAHYNYVVLSDDE